MSGSFLKAANVNSDQDGYVVVDVDLFEDERDNSSRVRLTLQRNEKEYEFDLNKTNAQFVKNQGIETPRKLVGCVLYFKKALVRNPKTNAEVESLRISRVVRPQ